MHLHRLRRHCVSCRSLIAVAVGYFRGFMVIARSVAERVTNLTPTHMSPIKSGYIKRMEAHLSFEVTLGVQRRKGKVVPRAPPAVMRVRPRAKHVIKDASLAQLAQRPQVRGARARCSSIQSPGIPHDVIGYMMSGDRHFPSKPWCSLVSRWFCTLDVPFPV
ncbi:hypothetical protein IWX47DRAFT_427240 [Phyllosticta citricarpa]